MPDFGSLWVGRPLSKIEKTCLASFVYHKHNITLFVYDMNLEVPDGVVKKDARIILPEDRIFKTDNSYGPFADMFRYKMIKETGLIWTDTDNICLQSRWKLKEYAFGLQGGGHGLVANGMLKAPKDSDLIAELVEISDSFDKTKIKWGEIGPQLLTEKIKKYSLEKYIKEPETFYPVNYWEWDQIFQKKYRKKVLKDCQNSYTLQIWNQMLNRQGFDNNNFEPGSAMDYFANLYLGGNSEN
jgi:hypothetical protein